MLKIIAKIIFALGGWKLKGAIPDDVKKCVVIGAPHTSNWDFVWAICALNIYGYKIKYLIKNTYFKSNLFAWFFRLTGGIPVDRSKSNNLTDELKNLLKNDKNLYIVIPPEGTRKKVDKWKTGFYHVAIDTHLPIALAFLDYKKKEAGFLDVFYPTGNKYEDFLAIEKYYLDIHPAHPELYNKEIILRANP